MNIRHYTDNSFVVADVYPHADEAADTRFLAASPHIAVMPEGDLLYNGRRVTVAGETRRAADMLLAMIEAERIAGAPLADRSELQRLAEALRSLVTASD